MNDFTNHRMMTELRRAYLKSLAAKLQELAAAIADRDFASAVRIGHQLKGSGKSYGYPDVSEFGSSVEDAALNGRAAALENLALEMRHLKTVQAMSASPQESE